MTGFFGGQCLGGSNGAEGDKHSEVEGDGVVEEGANDFLDEFYLLFGKWR